MFTFDKHGYLYVSMHSVTNPEPYTEGYMCVCVRERICVCVCVCVCVCPCVCVCVCVCADRESSGCNSFKFHHFLLSSLVKLPNSRREGHFSCQPGTRTLPLRMSNESYPPPPPPPPNRLRTFNPDGQIVRSPNQSPSSVVYPSGMEPYGTLNKANVKQDTLGSLHRNIDESTNSRKPSDPWHGQGAVIGESVIV